MKGKHSRGNRSHGDRALRGRGSCSCESQAAGTREIKRQQRKLGNQQLDFGLLRTTPLLPLSPCDGQDDAAAAADFLFVVVVAALAAAAAEFAAAFELTARVTVVTAADVDADAGFSEVDLFWKSTQDARIKGKRDAAAASASAAAAAAVLQDATPQLSRRRGRRRDGGRR